MNPYLSRLSLAAALISSCAALSFATPAAATITLGASVQMSGGLANTGRYYHDGYQFAIDQINKAGGIKVGGKQEQLALKILDNQSDNNLAVRQYTQLVTDDKINLLLGPFASDAVLATSSVAEKYEVPMIQGGGASDQIFSRGYKYIFGTLPVGEQVFREHDRRDGQAQSRAEDGGAALRRRRVRRRGRRRHAQAAAEGWTQDRPRRALQQQCVRLLVAAVADQVRSSPTPCSSRVTRPRS